MNPSKMTTINIEIADEEYEEVKQLFLNLGFTLEEAALIFFEKCLEVRGFPFNENE